MKSYVELLAELLFHEHEVVNMLSALLQTCDDNVQIGMMFSFDGAARGNPGPSSLGHCAWWGTWELTAIPERQEVTRLCRAPWTWDKEKARLTRLFGFDPAVLPPRKAVLNALEEESRDRKMGRPPVSSKERELQKGAEAFTSRRDQDAGG